VESLAPVQEKYFKYLENTDYLDEVLEKGRIKAEKKANEKIKEIYSKLGLVLPR
jgi:hypothetical protein